MMKRVAVLGVLILLVAVVAAPAAAFHDDTGGPIIPWHHDELTFSVGDEIPPVGARWGTCSRGLAQAVISSAEFTLTIDGEVVNAEPTATGPFNDVEMIDLDWEEACIPGSHGEFGWWVFWTFDTVDLSAPGEYEVHLEFGLSHQVTDGGDLNPVDRIPDKYGSGLVVEGTVTIVVEA